MSVASLENQLRNRHIVGLCRELSLSDPDIFRRLAREGIRASETTVQRILHQAGFVKVATPHQHR